MTIHPLTIEIRTPSGWQEAATVTLSGTAQQGTAAPCVLEYDFDYAESCIVNDRSMGSYALSCHFDVDVALKSTEHWPAFLLDLFPQGAALRYVLDHYRFQDHQENYWSILGTARLSPPGNLRVQQDFEPTSDHPGFEREEVIAKGPDFLEYMISCGAPISGTTGAGGAAPKFQLREDIHGRFHGEGALSDELTRSCWLVKFPRGDRSQRLNKSILKAEKAWYDIAGQVGLRTGEELIWESDCLFIPRFDRKVTEAGLEYPGMESFYSLVGSAVFGSRFQHETYTDALYRFSNQPKQDLLEYLLRDILNIAMGNTDNHGRNQSVLKSQTQVKLSPLYDFAPMRYDPEGIMRSTRWEKEDIFLREAERLYLERYQFDRSELVQAISEMWNRFQKIKFSDYDFDQTFIENQKKSIEDLEKQIEQFVKGN